MFCVLDKGAAQGLLFFDAALWNALPARLVQGLLHTLHKYKVRAEAVRAMKVSCRSCSTTCQAV